MSLRPVLLATMLLSFTCSWLEYGIYWYIGKQYQYPQWLNLLFALFFGLGYFGGAMLSHRLAVRFGSKPVILACVAWQVLFSLLMMLWPGPVLMWEGNFLFALASGIQWPMIEARLAAGRTPREASRALGKFNLSWAATAFLALGLNGAALSAGPRWFFLVNLLVNLAGGCVVAFGFGPDAAPLHDDHPEQPTPETLALARRLLQAATLGMVACYAILFICSPLIPDRLKALAVPTALATWIPAAAFAVRFVIFAAFERWHGWHLRRWPLFVGLSLLPVALYVTLLGPHWIWVLAGQAAFGFALGFVYTASIDYGLLVHAASVEGSGNHEASVGLGFAGGPACGLLAVGLAALPGLSTNGWLTIGLLPMVALALIALRPLLRRSPAPAAIGASA